MFAATAACGPSNFFGDLDSDAAPTDSETSGSESLDDDAQPDPSADPDPTATPDPTVDPDPTGMPPPDPVPTCAPVLPAGAACPEVLQQPTIIYDGDWIFTGAMAIDDNALYASVAEGETPNIQRIDKCTGESYALAHDAYPAEIVATGDSIAWSDAYDSGDLLIVPKSGGDPKPLAEGLWPYSLVAAGNLLVFSTGDGLWNVPVNGGRATRYDVPPGYSYAIAYDGQSVFVTDYDGSIYQLDPVTGAYELLLTDSAEVVFAADCDYLFWRDWNYVMHRTERATLSTYDLEGLPVYAVAQDADIVYVAAEESLTAFDKETLATVELSSHPNDFVIDVAVDATYVYWLTANDATLWAAPKLPAQ
jgi:hypothetical protein